MLSRKTCFSLGKKVSLDFQPAVAILVLFIRPLLCHWVIDTHLLPSWLYEPEPTTLMVLPAFSSFISVNKESLVILLSFSTASCLL